MLLPSRSSGGQGLPTPATEVKSFFERRFQEYGHTPKALDWSPKSQQLRFQVLCEIGDLRGKRVADLGCGLGDLYAYLQPRYEGVYYTGLDFSALFVDEASKSHPEARFQVLDVLRQPIPGKFDFVFSSGIHNLETGRNEEEMALLLEKAWMASEQGVAINMLSARASQHTDGRHYYDAKAIVSAAIDHANYVVLRHDYLPHDFTVYMYRRRPQLSEPASGARP